MAALSLALVAALAFDGRTAKAATGADLHIAKRVKPLSVPVGQKQTFIIHVRNERRKNATSVKVTARYRGR
jgi:hypothetical protein